MNYQKIYNSICERGQIRTMPEDMYTEKHHIIPRCLGGNESDENMTILTAKEHFICHKLLCAIYPEHYGLAHALLLMTLANTNQQRYISSANIYMNIRENAIRLMTKNKRKNPPTRERNGMYGKHHSDETKKQQSEIRKLWIKNNGHPNLGNKYSNIIKKDISEKKKEQWRSGVYDREKISKLTSIRFKKCWQDPEFRRKQLERLNSDDHKLRMKKLNNKLWSNPEYIKRHSERMQTTQLGGDNNNARPVRDLKTGDVYNTRKSAAKHFNVTRQTILAWIRSGKMVNV